MRARIDPRSTRRAAIVAGVIVTIGAAIAACSSDSNPAPPNDFTTSSGSGAGSTASSSASGTGGSESTSTTTTTTTGTSTSTTTSGAGGGGTGGAPPNCDGPNGCYSCAPKTGNQFLDACTTSQCSPFDNVARLPLYNNGNLPAIP
jgi:hypothetical protein